MSVNIGGGDHWVCHVYCVGLGDSFGRRSLVDGIDCIYICVRVHIIIFDDF